MSKKIFIIFGHNRYKSGSSFNAAIRDTFIEEAKKKDNQQNKNKSLFNSFNSLITL